MNRPRSARLEAGSSLLRQRGSAALGFAVLAFAFGLILLNRTIPAFAQPDEAARIQADAERVSARLDALHREADRLAGEARTLLNQLRSREVERLIAAEELRRATDDVNAATEELGRLEEEMAQVSNDIEADLPPLRNRLVELYKLGEGRYARLLLSTEDIRHAGRAWRTVAMLAHMDRRRVEERREQLEKLRTTEGRLRTRQEQLVALRAEAVRADAAARRALEEHNALIRRIDQQRDLTAQLAGELQMAHQNLQITMQALARGDAVAYAGLPIGPFRGDLPWPVTGRVRRRFSGTGIDPGSSGIEIAAGQGQAVRAVHGGIVTFADAFSGFGNLIIVEHDSGNFTLYGYLLDMLVARGDRVDSGQPVGSVGMSPIGEPGLYFELRIDARPVDPLQWLRAR